MLQSYLTDRYQLVQIEDCSSAKEKVKLGVPQGSILGSILFLIFINDICNVSPFLNFVLFADDTTISKRGKDVSKLFEEFNREMPAIQKWINDNNLQLNLKKTNWLLFSPKRSAGKDPIKLIKSHLYLSLGYIFQPI